MGKKSNRGLVVIERGAGAGALLWLLVGGAVGAGLGLLFAPQKGEDTRKLLRERLAGLKQSAQDALEDLAGEEEEPGEEELEPGDEDEDEEEEVEAEEEEAETTASDEEDSDQPRITRPSARAELEQRLARARARRQRALAEEDEEPVA